MEFEILALGGYLVHFPVLAQNLYASGRISLFEAQIPKNGFLGSKYPKFVLGGTPEHILGLKSQKCKNGRSGYHFDREEAAETMGPLSGAESSPWPAARL